MEGAEMKQSKQRIVIVCLAVLIVAAGLGGFFFGRKSESLKYQEEQQYNIQLNRSDLEGLGEIDGTIYVTGHKSPDSDTVGCCVAYASLLRKLGYDAVPVVLGRINPESEYILNAAGIEAPKLLEDASGLNMVLVDHSEYTQSADGLADANVIMIIDHHGAGSVTTGNPLIYDGKPLGAAGTSVWLRYRNYGFSVDKPEATALLGSILSDTKDLKSNTTTFADREAVASLSRIAGISDVDDFYQDMFKASLSYEGMTDEEIFFNDYKEYESGGTKYAIGNVNAYDEETAADLIGRMKATMSSTFSSTGMDMAFAMVSIMHDEISKTYLVPSDEAAEEVLEAAFGDTAVKEGDVYEVEPYMSRKQKFVPAVTDVLEAHPKE